MTQPYGVVDASYARGYHAGTDYGCPTGEPFVAAADGDVQMAADAFGDFGRLLILDHGDGWTTWYAHLSRIDVRGDESVSQGQVCGLTGATGRVTGPHLHWEARLHDTPLDPAAYMEE